jgi:hypothetical protein
MRKFAVLLVTVQTAGVVEPKVTGAVVGVDTLNGAEVRAVGLGIGVKEMGGVAGPTLRLWDTVAAANTFVAVTEALTVQMPRVRKLAVLPETVQTAGVLDVKVTGAVVVVDTLNAAEVRAVGAGTGVKMRTGLANATVMSCVTRIMVVVLVAAVEAVAVQMPAVRKLTVLPETEQTAGVKEPKVTGANGVAVALSGADVRAVAGGTVAKLIVATGNTLKLCVADAAA